MSEDEAKAQVEALVGQWAMPSLQKLAALVVAGNTRQNLIAQSTIDSIWSRHILDSVQLLRWGRPSTKPWLDIGSGGGFPGLAVASTHSGPMILVEPRRKRAEFLRDVAAALTLRHVTVLQQRVETVLMDDAGTISARAVAPLRVVFRLAHHCSSKNTRWLLPRGASYDADLHAAQQDWKGVFHVEHSLSDPAAAIIIASEVCPR